MIVQKQTKDQVLYLKVFRPWAGKEAHEEARPIKGLHCTWTEDITAAIQMPDNSTLETLGLKNSEGNHYDLLTP